MQLATRALFLVIAGSLVACASIPDPQGPTPPRTVYIPAGWLGGASKTPKTEAPTEATPEEATTTTSEAAPIETTPAEDEIVVVELASTEPKSGLIRNGFANPIPHGTFAGYAGDTGLDIASPPRPVYAIASGTMDYSEWGHTRWVGKNDTAFSVRITLDAPIAWKSRHITHLYYTHLSAIAVEQAESSKTKHHVVAGERIGTSGVANGLPHLHLGLLLDGDVEQSSWDTILTEKDIRVVLGGYKNGDVLPSE